MYQIIGAIMPWAATNTPKGWADCDGQTIPKSLYDRLWKVIGYKYGGSGAHFCLPDLRTRMAVGVGQTPFLSPYNLGDHGGNEEVMLHPYQLAVHNHIIKETQFQLPCTDQLGTENSPAGNYPAGIVNSSTSGVTANTNLYSTTAGTTGLVVNVKAVTPTMSGVNKPVPTMPPYFAIRYLICYDNFIYEQ